MNRIVIIILSVFLISCGSSKKAFEDGNYERAVRDATLALKKNPGNEKQARILQKAFNTATKNDLAEIERLKKTTQENPDHWVDIYEIYDRMMIREVTVIPVIPLRVDGKELPLNMPDVDALAEEAKVNASQEIYEKASTLLQRGGKQNAREAYELFDQLVEFNFNYRDAREKREEAKTKGSTNVFVEMVNQTGNQLPAQFEKDLLSFRAGSFSDEWIQYHTEKKPGIEYEYEVDLHVNELVIGRDQQQQRQRREQARVIVGYRNGKDSDGNTVRVPQYGTVYADVLEVRQYKPIRIGGSVIYKDKSGKTLATLPVEREEAWENIYAQFRGDERALSQETIQKIRNGEKPYPQNKEFLEISGKLLNQVVVKLFEENAKNLK